MSGTEGSTADPVGYVENLRSPRGAPTCGQWHDSLVLGIRVARVLTDAKKKTGKRRLTPRTMHGTGTPNGNAGRHALLRRSVPREQKQPVPAPWDDPVEPSPENSIGRMFLGREKALAHRSKPLRGQDDWGQVRAGRSSSPAAGCNYRLLMHSLNRESRVPSARTPASLLAT